KSELNTISYTMPIASAQVKSAIIFAALGSKSPVEIFEPFQSRDHTELMLNYLGVDIQTVGKKIIVPPLSNSLSNFNMSIPGDPSTAAFFAAAAAMIPNSDLTIKNISANPTRIGFFNILEKMGGGISWSNIRKECGELVGDLHIYYEPLHGVTIAKNEIPSLIDELPIISVMASTAEGPTIVEGAEELRVKET
ncbi:MAG: 3-phosphoshikimate 1-carboxyvinyltransferase, partial [Candidatus Marinimicrobia bacterium]|nr:3-phosphoshikimate 1-carboxyvinyltransferase [Candidatus Neomarinimicrobiota bacterium]